MKATGIKITEEGHILLTCELSFLFGLIKRNVQFIATKEYPKGYWNWRSMPNKMLVNDNMSFQLDSWCEDLLKKD